MHPPFKTQLLEARKIHHFQTKKKIIFLNFKTFGFPVSSRPCFFFRKKKGTKNPMFSGVLLGQRMATQGREHFCVFFFEGEVEQPLHHQVDLEGFPYLDNFLMVFSRVFMYHAPSWACAIDLIYSRAILAQEKGAYRICDLCWEVC